MLGKINSNSLYILHVLRSVDKRRCYLVKSMLAEMYLIN